MTSIDPFQPVVGHGPSLELLRQAIRRQALAPAYLFAGAAGIGKALVARCWLEAIFIQDRPQEAQQIRHKLHQGNHPDLHWVAPTYSHQGQLLSATEAAAAGVKKKAPPQIRIEQVREIGQFLSRPPLAATQQVVVIAQAETMAEAAANALLKTLEEPGRATLILLADREAALLPTIVSRCQRIPFLRLSGELTRDILIRNGQAELLQDPILVAMGQGSPGQTIELGEQLQPVTAELKAALCQRPSDIRSALGWAKEIDQELDSPAQLALLDYLQYYYWQTDRDTAAIEAIDRSRRQLLAYVQPRLVWECLLLAIAKDPRV